MLTVGSVCSGIGAFEKAFDEFGVPTLWCSEIDKQAASVHARHFPRTYQLGDIRHVGKHNAAPVTILLGGTPCQDFSIAGKRAGLEGEKSILFFEFIRIVRELKPVVVIWENVFGALSSNDGRDFAAVLHEFQKCGALDIAYRIFDSQHFGIPQRRRRVFAVVDFGGLRSGEVLFEPESAGGYRPSSRTTGADIAYALTTSNQRNDANSTETFIGVPSFEPHTAGQSGVEIPAKAGTLRANGSGLQYASTNIPGDYLVPEVAYTLRSTEGNRSADNNTFVPGISGTLAASGAGSARVAGQRNEQDFLITSSNYRVRRLTPRECERLQGFPDDWTRWGAANEELADTPRYRMCGNSISVPVARWIARRLIQQFD